MVQIVTVFSELALISSGVYGIFKMTDPTYKPYIFAIIGYSFIILAAIIGIIRFSWPNFPPNFVVRCHQTITKISATTGMVCISAEIFEAYNYFRTAVVTCITGFLILVFPLFLSEERCATITEIICSVSTELAMICYVIGADWMGFIGSAFLIVAAFASNQPLFDYTATYPLLLALALNFLQISFTEAFRIVY